MAAVITVEDVKNGFDTTVADDEVQMLIDVIDVADVCLDGASVPEVNQRALKIYAVRHMLTMQVNSGKGTVTNEHATSGASRSYSAWKGVGVNSTPYGNLLKQLDTSGCIVSLLENTQQMAFMSVGGGC